MHPYSINTKERKIILFSLAILSILIIYFLNKVMNISFPWFIGPPSIMTVYFLLFYVFNNFLWKLSFFRKINLIKTVNLNGKWDGYITTSYDKHESKVNVQLEIEQNWTEIIITLSTKQSSSKSIASSLIINKPNNVSLAYNYLNKPSASTPKSMNMHYGTTILNLEGNKLEGEYFSGSGRKNVGEIYLKKSE